MRNFITHLNSSAFSEAHAGNQLAISKIECPTMQILRLGGVAMNCGGRDERIENVEELDAKREDPLVVAVQAGVPGAFAQLYAIYSPRLYRTAFAITKNPEDAQDVLQETFLRAHLKVHAFEGRSSIYSWMSRIAINSALMILRKRRARPELLFDLQPHDRCEAFFAEPKDPSPNPEEVCDLRQCQAKAWRAIRRLDQKLLMPLRMQMTYGCSVKEISQALNISEAAAKSRLHRARKCLYKAHRPKVFHNSAPAISLSVRARRDSVLPALSYGMCQNPESLKGSTNRNADHI
jgi:RNA polymerase sigma-70 factor, ECF subfamily